MWRRQAASHAPREEARRRLRPMARVKDAVAGEGTPIGRSNLYIVRGGGQPAPDVIRVSNMDGEINLLASRSQQLAPVHACRGDGYLIYLYLYLCVCTFM
jgi:hypothetical protein